MTEYESSPRRTRPPPCLRRLSRYPATLSTYASRPENGRRVLSRDVVSFFGCRHGLPESKPTHLPFLFSTHPTCQIFADKKTGRVPRWLGTITYTVFAMMWKSYDMVWKKVFGSGEVSNGAWKALGSGVGAVGWQWKAQEQESKR